MGQDIDWTDETENVQGTPVNRQRLMGMQGYFAGNTTITEESDTVTKVVESSSEGTTQTTITENNDGSVIVDRHFLSRSGSSIRKVTRITESGLVINVQDTVQG